jgi:DNA-binding PucR family transcriptional regulator
LEVLSADGQASASAAAFDPRLASAVSTLWNHLGMTEQLVPWRSGFACLLPDGDAEGADRSTELADAALPGLHYVLAVGASVATPRDFGQSLQQAEDLLALARRLGLLDRVVRFEELAIERMLLESMDASATHEAFVQQTLGRLMAYDADHNRDLLSTLRTYVAADYAPRLAAQRLFIHVNTVHLRVRRIAELVGGSWPHGEQRFRVELALRLVDLSDIRARRMPAARTSSAPPLA